MASPAAIVAFATACALLLLPETTSVSPTQPKPVVIRTLEADPKSTPFAPIDHDPMKYLCFAMDAKPLPLPKAQQRSAALADLFTVVMLTYKRDEKLAITLKEIGKIPFVHKVIVYWNDVKRPMNYTWPRIHVPVVFLNASKNSMNNRFLPSELIETEAVFSFDDDKPATWKDILIGYAKWLENRDVIVGSYARRGFVNSNGTGEYGNQKKTGEYNLVLTGAAFMHRKYLDLYTNNMPAEIRQLVDDEINCEDLAMNFLIANATQKPHVHTVTSAQWKLQDRNLLGGGNDECLSCRPQHYAERRQCIANFTEIYGYNPLQTSTFHALPSCS